MAVHVDEVHTEVTAARFASHSASEGSAGAGHEHGHEHAPGTASTGRPGAGEDVWRRAESRVVQLRRRVAAEGFDD